MSKERDPDEADKARGERIRALREAKGLSQEKLAKMTGIARTRISRVESGHSKFSSPDLQQDYARALGISHGELVEIAFPRDATRPSLQLVDTSHADAPAPLEPHEHEETPADDGRWRKYARRYPEFSAMATIRKTGGTPEGVLDAASDMLGWRRGDGPTAEESLRVIDQMEGLLRRGRAPGLPEGREGTEDELEPPPRGKGRR